MCIFYLSRLQLIEELILPYSVICFNYCFYLPTSRNLRQLILSGKLSPEAAIINAAVLPDVFILHVAARQALQAKHRGGQKTRSPHAELVFCISGSKHVSHG